MVRVHVPELEESAFAGSICLQGVPSDAVAKSTVVYHASRVDAPIDPRFGRRYDWMEVQSAHDAGMSRLECMKKFGFSAYTWTMAVKRGAIFPRPNAIPLDKLLVRDRRTNRSRLKRRLIAEGLKENRCEICGITHWMGKPVSMQLHHKNGDGSDTACRTWSSSAERAIRRPRRMAQRTPIVI